MSINVNKLKKTEILWLYNHHCKAHQHRFLEHLQCFEKEYDSLEECPLPKPRTGFLDIETSDLNAAFGYMFSYAIKELDGKILGRRLQSSEIRDYIFDKQLVAECVADIRKFERIVVYYGRDRRFDVPFVRSRSLKYGIPFPSWRDLCVVDCYDLVRNKMRLRYNRLASACEFLDIPHKAHPMHPPQWTRAMAGNDKALQYIWKHNVEDVESLERLWKKLERFGSTYQPSI